MKFEVGQVLYRAVSVDGTYVHYQERVVRKLTAKGAWVGVHEDFICFDKEEFWLAFTSRRLSATKKEALNNLKARTAAWIRHCKFRLAEAERKAINLGLRVESTSTLYADKESQLQAHVALFCDLIDSTGGVLLDKNGQARGLVADEDWLDMADFYMNSCALLQRAPQVKVQTSAGTAEGNESVRCNSCQVSIPTCDAEFKDDDALCHTCFHHRTFNLLT